MDDKEIIKLIKEAKKARANAYSPYSKFPVGAALLTKEGKIFSGVNIENASYGLSNCAERTAIFKALSEGYKDFTAIAVIADTERPVPPCGSCRQVIYEFAENLTIIMSNLNYQYKKMSIRDLLPGAFNRKDIK
ncbi:cytidine deaminase [Natronospora cellulosivora (SeqCode)]